MSKLEAVFYGTTPPRARTEDDFGEVNAAYDRVFDAITPPIAVVMNNAEKVKRESLSNRGLIGRVMLRAFSSEKRQSLVNSLAYNSPIETTTLELFDTLISAAKVSETQRVSYEPDQLADQCLEEIDTQRYLDLTGYDLERMPLMIQATARALAGIAFELPVRRQVDRHIPEPKNYFEVSSSGV